MAVGSGYIRPLHEIAVADTARVGAKAAHLGELLNAGFRVPDGFALTVDAFEHFRAVHGFGPEAGQEAVAQATLPEDVTSALDGAYAAIGDATLAVRSSSVAEDLAGASFAGQYETILGVRGEAALLRAVRRCWASAYSDRVSAYRMGGANGDVPPMAVLVQRLVEPSAAGVAFTANPVTGDRDEVVINAVRGLGDRLVSGEAQPDEWVVRGDRAERRSAPDDAIRAEQARSIAETARRIEAHFGAAQDVEWAIAGDELFILQARPITALPALGDHTPVSVEVPDGFWQRETTHFPRPASPMLRGFMDLHNAAFREMCAAYGLLLEGVEMREIGGWMYARAVPLGGKERPAPPAAVLWLLARAVPQLRRRIAACREAIRCDKHGRDVEQWYAEWQPDLARRIHALAAADVGFLTDAELDDHLDHIEHLLDRCVHVHFLLHGALIMVLGELAFACRDLLTWDDRRMLELLNGLSEKSSEPSRRLAELARLASGTPAVRRRLERLDRLSVDDVLAADQAFATAFHAYQRDYGCRALGYEFIEPTLSERPELILGLVRDQVARGYDPAADADALAATRTAALAEAQAALAGRAADLARFERALARATRAYPVREDSEFYTVSAPLGVAHHAALELGRRLATRGQLAAPEDVFHLSMAEARAALRAGQRWQEEVATRRAERARVLAHPGPASYGRDPGPPPDARALPGEARFAMEALQWVMLDRILAPEESQQTQAGGGRITGIAAAPGRYSGPVRMVRDETEFGKVQPGDVLVCTITSPVWSVLFPSVGALITDTGGILSHAAIIAREYRLPAVVGTGNATELLADGQRITVDGGEGVVLIDD